MCPLRPTPSTRPCTHQHEEGQHLRRRRHLHEDEGLRGAHTHEAAQERGGAQQRVQAHLRATGKVASIFFYVVYILIMHLHFDLTMRLL